MSKHRRRVGTDRSFILLFHGKYFINTGNVTRSSGIPMGKLEKIEYTTVFMHFDQLNFL